MNYYSSTYIRPFTKDIKYNLRKFFVKTNLFIVYSENLTSFNSLQFNVKRYSEFTRTPENIIKYIYMKYNYYFKMFITKHLIKMLKVFKENVLIIAESQIKNIYKTVKTFIDISKYNFISLKKYNTSVNVFPVYLSSDQIYKVVTTDKIFCDVDKLKNIQSLKSNKLFYTKDINEINILIGEVFTKQLNNIQFDFYIKAKKLILGQDNILIKIAGKLINIHNNKSNKPLANWLLCGPSGTGKTELAKILSRYTTNTKNSLVHINMSELQERHSVSKLLGSPPGYAGNQERPSEVIDKVIKNPKSTVLFDEIEKAHKKIYPVFLQMLEDGTLTSSTNVKAKFNQAFIVFTSNLGSQILDKNSSANIQKMTYIGAVIKAVEKKFPPELINRLDDILIFNPLVPYISYKLLLKKSKVFKRLRYHKSIKLLTSIQLSSPVRGARFVLNTIDHMLLNKKNLNNLLIKFDDNTKCFNLNK